MHIKLSDIHERFRTRGLFNAIHGGDSVVTGFAAVEACGNGDIVFVEDRKHVDAVRTGAPAAVVTSASIADELKNIAGLGILVTDDVKLAHALVRQAYADIDLHATEWPRVHPGAVVHESTAIPSTTTVGPGAVIGRNVLLGERVVVQANVVIENDVTIGDDSVLCARAFIGRGCRVGKRVVLKTGCVIGGEGFGFAPDREKHYHRVPHQGIVVIEDDVSIGANTNIDRATYHETRIGRGCKIDALCHIAHNVSIGADSILVAQTGIAGSSRLGKRVIASGQTGILDHKTIVDDVIMVHRCGVSEDITKPGMYAAGPPQPFKEYARNVAVSRRLYELWQRVQQLEKRLADLLESKD